MKKILLIALLSSQIATAKDGIPGEGLTPAKIIGLKTPESVVQAKDGTIYISEINGFDVDGDGQISKVDKKGSVSVFAKGMNDPKGLVLVHDKIYATDKNKVLEVNKDGTWRIYTDTSAFPTPPKFLNDIEADKLGNLYVSDSGDLKSGGAIYKIAKDGKVSTIADSQNPNIRAPNGLLFVGLNTLLEVDFDSGILYRVNITSGEMRKMAEGFGGGDGIIKTKTGKLFISDFKNGIIHQVYTGKSRPFKYDMESPADFVMSNDGKYLLVPYLKKGELEYIPVQ